ncbi:MAG: aminotransferase class V-fold PLP-dependent enzyme [Oligosphaeraceae bacterium]
MTPFLETLPEPLPPPVDLDQAAGHRPSPLCLQWQEPLARRFSRNPHGLTKYAEECRRALRMAERTLLQLAGADERDTGVLWCANGTAALNLALRGFPFPRENAPLAVDAGGHHALTETARSLSRPLAPFLLEDSGRLPANLPDDTALAAFSLVNNETGLLWDGDASPLPPGCPILLDACQAFGKHPLPWNVPRVEMMVLSSRKLGGPATGAALLFRKSLKLTPWLTGGGQQGGIVGGTVDVVSALLFTAAAQEACRRAREVLPRVAALNRLLREGLQTLGKGRWPLFSPAQASPYILYFAIPGYQGALVARLLAENHGILVGTGSACTAESGETSALLRAKGVPEALARSALRISLSPESTQEEIQAFLQALPRVLKEY